MKHKVRNKYWSFLYIFVFLYFLFLDRFFKFLAINNIFEEPIKIIGDIFSFNFASNYNIAFSLPFSGIGLNVLIILIILSLIAHLATSFKLSNYKYINYLALIILGAISNLYDRLNYGFVIDYFDLKYFTIFNIADAMIFFGVLGMVIILSKK